MSKLNKKMEKVENAKAELKKDFEEILVRGKITATSNRQSEEFKGEHNAKTVYFTCSEKAAQALQDFGMQMYTTKDEDKTSYFVCRMAKNVSIFFNDSEIEPVIVSGTVEKTPENFSTDVPVAMYIIKGEKSRNTFFRIKAFLLDSMDDIIYYEMSNPFANEEKEIEIIE